MNNSSITSKTGGVDTLNVPLKIYQPLLTLRQLEAHSELMKWQLWD